jgi:hypothetical protein
MMSLASLVHSQLIFVATRHPRQSILRSILRSPRKATLAYSDGDDEVFEQQYIIEEAFWVNWIPVLGFISGLSSLIP